MTTTVRLLATYDGSPPQTLRDLPDDLAAFFVAQGNASLDLTGGIPYVPYVAPDTYELAKVHKDAAGNFLNLTDADGDVVSAGGGGGGVTSITVTAPLNKAGTASVPVLSMPASTTSQAGYMSTAQVAALSSAMIGLTVTAPLLKSGSAASPTLDISAATTAQAGAMTTAQLASLTAVTVVDSTPAALMALRRAGTLTPGQLYSTNNGTFRYRATSATRFIPVDNSPIITGSRLTGLGDSIMNYQWYNNFPATLSIVAWASSQLEVGFNFETNRAIGGTTPADMVSGQVPATVTDSSETVWIHTGVNGLSSTAATANTVEAIIGQFRSALDSLSPAKQCVIVDAVLPFLASANPRTIEIPRLNTMLAALCREYPNVVFNDIYPALLDTTSLVGDAVTSNFFDNVIHPNTKGAQLCGKLSAKNLARVKVVPSYTSTLVAAVPDMTGTGGTAVPGSGTITGSIPSGIAVQVATGTADVVTTIRTSTSTAVGNRLNIVATNPAASASQVNVHLAVNTGNNASFPSGTRVQGTIYGQIKSSNLLNTLSAYIVQNGANYGSGLTNSASETPNVQFDPASLSFAIKTNVLLLGANTTTLDIFLNLGLKATIGASVDYDLIRFAIDKVVVA